MKNTTKYQAVQTAIKAGDYKKALGIARKFFFGFTEEEKRCIEIAADVMNGKGSFYTSIGVQTDEMTERAKEILRAKYAAI